MKVFVSWSGQRSKAVAEIISDWIKCVLQASQPWISTRDIDKGAIWFSEISDQLKDTAAGIVCLTQENKNKPWILFETGALAKGLSTSRVCTFLIDLESTDVEDPLAQFNHTFPERTSMWGLASSLNNCLELNRLDERILRQVFDTYWPQFEENFAKALKDNLPTEISVPRTEDSMLAEILSNTRSLANRVRNIEMRAQGTLGGLLDVSSTVDPVVFIQNLMDQGVTPEEAVSMAEKSGYSAEIFRGMTFVLSANSGKYSVRKRPRPTPLSE